MRNLFLGMALMAGTWAAPANAQTNPAPAARPTIVLLHGAFADSSGWNGVAKELLQAGYPVVSVANPLRSVKGDAEYLSSTLSSIPGEKVVVGHSYAGMVMSTAAAGSPNVKALVYVAGFAPEVGESGASIGARFPEGTLGQALAKPVLLSDGSKDLYIDQSKFWAQFAADVPKDDAAQMAATQRPITEAALNEPARAAAWKTIPSWFIYGSLDKNIPASAQAFMAKRAKAREAIEVKGASHVVMISHSKQVAELIQRAASAK